MPEHKTGVQPAKRRAPAVDASPGCAAFPQTWRHTLWWLSLAVLSASMIACQPQPEGTRELSDGHIVAAPPEPESIAAQSATLAALATPAAAQTAASTARADAAARRVKPVLPSARYSISVREVPVGELLFALSRDAAINFDIDPAISGLVSINAVDQTLLQILRRIARQVLIDYDFYDGALSIAPLRAVLRYYPIDYINIGRKTRSSIAVSTQINASAADQTAIGSILNTSTTRIEAESHHQLWQTLATTLRRMLLSDPITAQLYPDGVPAGESLVVPNPENGLLVVRAAALQHRQIARYIDLTMAAARRQVLVEATIVEVELSDRYRAGIDWEKFANNSGLRVQQSLTAGGPASGLANAPFWLFSYTDSRLDISVRLLQEFGTIRVLSSPKLMVLNNHTATLKAVDNRVYFDIESEIVPATTSGGSPTVSTKSSVRTVPEGIILTLTPQISDNGEVTISIRPTVSRVIGTVADPAAAAINATNLIPIFRVRELESLLRLSSGQIAVLGGLMQNSTRNDSAGVPWLSRLPFIGELFKSRSDEYTKSELVIFLRPWVIDTPSTEYGGPLQSFNALLPQPEPESLPERQTQSSPEALESKAYFNFN